MFFISPKLDLLTSFNPTFVMSFFKLNLPTVLIIQF